MEGARFSRETTYLSVFPIIYTYSAIRRNVVSVHWHSFLKIAISRFVFFFLYSMTNAQLKKKQQQYNGKSPATFFLYNLSSLPLYQRRGPREQMEISETVFAPFLLSCHYHTGLRLPFRLLLRDFVQKYVFYFSVAFSFTPNRSANTQRNLGTQYMYKGAGHATNKTCRSMYKQRLPVRETPS